MPDELIEKYGSMYNDDGKLPEVIEDPLQMLIDNLVAKDTEG